MQEAHARTLGPIPRANLRIGVDLGGTKIEAVALAASGAELQRRRVETPFDDYPATLDAVVTLVHDLESELGTRGSVGIGHPGAVSPATGLIKNANSTWLNERPLQADLERRLGRELRLANDADCFALSEATDGAGAGYPSVFGVILGTGVGGAMVVEGRLIGGRNAITGEWGHTPLPWMTAGEHPGIECWCGRRGCLETVLSGPGMATDHGRETGTMLTAPEIVAAAGKGDGQAVATLLRYVDRLARGLAVVVDIFDPHAIVLGGGLSNLKLLYEAVPTRWGRHVFSDRVDTVLLPPRHGDSSGVRGAAWLCDREDLLDG